MFRAVFWVVLPCEIILHGSTTQKTALNITQFLDHVVAASNHVMSELVNSGSYFTVQPRDFTALNGITATADTIRHKPIETFIITVFTAVM
jgi:hypothetical protein